MYLWSQVAGLKVCWGFYIY